ncbi:MAG: hypothetical protein JSV49_06555 [Thermoplasmata archaeon]|nr:MAG: hypothetical protein JSV49_06555 [Thermoplasmata archaeon]
MKCPKCGWTIYLNPLTNSCPHCGFILSEN